MPQCHLEQVEQWIAEEALEAVKIGELTSWDGHSIRVKIDDMPVSAAKKGFDHFDC